MALITVQPGELLRHCPACGCRWGIVRIPTNPGAQPMWGRTTCCATDVAINGFVFPRMVSRDEEWRAAST